MATCVQGYWEAYAAEANRQTAQRRSKSLPVAKRDEPEPTQMSCMQMFWHEYATAANSHHRLMQAAREEASRALRERATRFEYLKEGPSDGTCVDLFWANWAKAAEEATHIKDAHIKALAARSVPPEGEDDEPKTQLTCVQMLWHDYADAGRRLQKNKEAEASKAYRPTVPQQFVSSGMELTEDTCVDRFWANWAKAGREAANSAKRATEEAAKVAALRIETKATAPPEPDVNCAQLFWMNWANSPTTVLTAGDSTGMEELNLTPALTSKKK